MSKIQFSIKIRQKRRNLDIPSTLTGPHAPTPDLETSHAQENCFTYRDTSENNPTCKDALGDPFTLSHARHASHARVSFISFFLTYI